MAAIDLVDETYFCVPPQSLAPIVADPERWRQWWPELVLTVFMDRGPQGQRWSIAGDLVGSSEIWLEAVGEGTLVHYYLRADETEPGSPTVARPTEQTPAGWRRAAKIRARHAKSWKRIVWSLKDEVEGDRRPGC